MSHLWTPELSHDIPSILPKNFQNLYFSSVPRFAGGHVRCPLRRRPGYPGGLPSAAPWRSQERSSPRGEPTQDSGAGWLGFDVQGQEGDRPIACTVAARLARGLQELLDLRQRQRFVGAPIKIGLSPREDRKREGAARDLGCNAFLLCPLD